MRYALVVALAASMPLAWTASAQAPPSAPRLVGPGPVDDTCLELPAGQLTVALQLEKREPTQLVSFRFGASRNRDADPLATIAAEVTPAPTTTAVPLAGRCYCYAVVNRAGSTGMDQLVAVTMTLIPR